MGYKADGFIVRVHAYADPDAVKAWLSAEVVVDALLGPLEADGYLRRVTHVQQSFGALEPVGDSAALRRRAASFGYEIVSLFAGDHEDPDFEIFLGLDPHGPRFAVGAAGREPGFRDDVARWVSAWSDGLARARVRFARARFEPARAPYPRPTPLRSSQDWPPGSLDQYLGRAWHQTDPECAVVLERLERAPLPPGAARSIDGNVVRIAFQADLHDAVAVANARTAHERWVTPLVPAEPEPGWDTPPTSRE